MGLFSDEDVNDAWLMIKSEPKLTRYGKLKFIKGFEGYWRQIKETREITSKLFTEFHIRLVVFEFLADPWTVGTSQRNRIYENPKNFGIALGCLVGLLRFHPEFVFYNEFITSMFIRNILALKDTPTHRNFIAKIVQVWKAKMLRQFKKIKDKQRLREELQKYEHFIGEIGM